MDSNVRSRLTESRLDGLTAARLGQTRRAITLTLGSGGCDGSSISNFTANSTCFSLCAAPAELLRIRLERSNSHLCSTHPACTTVLPAHGLEGLSSGRAEETLHQSQRQWQSPRRVPNTRCLPLPALESGVLEGIAPQTMPLPLRSLACDTS